MAKNQQTSPDFQAAASLFALGKLTSAEAANIAFQFLHSREYGPTTESSFSGKMEQDTQQPSGDCFDELRPPSLQRSAKSSIMALAQGLLREAVDPLDDIYNVGCFVAYVSDLMSEPEFDRAQIFTLLGNEETQLPYHDNIVIGAEAARLRQQIREAAHEYVNNPLNKDNSGE